MCKSRMQTLVPLLASWRFSANDVSVHISVSPCESHILSGPLDPPGVWRSGIGHVETVYLRCAWAVWLASPLAACGLRGPVHDTAATAAVPLSLNV